MIDLKGRTAVVFGLANKRSIAWAIAQKLSAAGAQLAICYQNERLRPEAEALTAELPARKRSNAMSRGMTRSTPSSPGSRSATANSIRWCTASPSRPRRS